MSFQLVLKSVTLNNLERRNGPSFCTISPNSVAFGDHYVKVVEEMSIAYLLQQKCAQRI